MNDAGQLSLMKAQLAALGVIWMTPMKIPIWMASSELTRWFRTIIDHRVARVQPWTFDAGRDDQLEVHVVKESCWVEATEMETED